MINQISVFIQNEKGRLSEVTQVLYEKNINISALSIADTTDFGILRLIVDDSEKANTALKEAGYTVSITKVIAMCVSDEPGGLAKALKVLNDNDVSIEYMYDFMHREEGNAYIIVRVKDNENASRILINNGIAVLDPNEAKLK